MATLVHDDLIDGATVRRGKQAAWAAHGADAARATATTSSRARLPSWPPRATSRRSPFSQTRRSASPAARRCSAGSATIPTRRWRRTSNAARSRPGSSSRPRAPSAPAAPLGRFGLNLGIAFQIADDILDCSGDTIETGKVAGTDLREGTPTLPLLLAAREDDAVRAALAGGPIEGALLRVAATGALERSRQVALDYAREARETLNGGVHREELESLADAVVNRKH